MDIAWVVLAVGANGVRSAGCELEHAEMIALRAAHGADCVLYTTLEPCVTCPGALAAAAAAHVVFDERDPRRGGGAVGLR